jgi:hypothetical protein
LQEVLTRHKGCSAAFLERRFEDVFAKYRELLLSPNYVTRRQSLKLLGELLLDRHGRAFEEVHGWAGQSRECIRACG